MLRVASYGFDELMTDYKNLQNCRQFVELVTRNPQLATMASSFLKIDTDLILHQPQIDFANELFELIDTNRTYLQEWLPWVEGTKTPNDSRQFLKNARLFSFGGQQFHTVIIYKGKIVGLVGFNAIHKKHKKGEIGYWIVQNMQGKGIVTKAVNRLIRYGFKHLDLNRILIRVSTNNLKSKQVAQRLGFTYEGTLRSDYLHNGQFLDMEIYGLLKSEFEK